MGKHHGISQFVQEDGKEFPVNLLIICYEYQGSAFVGLRFRGFVLYVLL